MPNKVHPFVARVESLLKCGMQTKGEFCRKMGKPRSWFALTMGKARAGKLLAVEVAAMADALSLVGPRTPDADRLIVLACRGE